VSREPSFVGGLPRFQRIHIYPIKLLCPVAATGRIWRKLGSVCLLGEIVLVVLNEGGLQVTNLQNVRGVKCGGSDGGFDSSGKATNVVARRYKLVCRDQLGVAGHPSDSVTGYFATRHLAAVLSRAMFHADAGR